MKLYIDTTQNDYIQLSLKEKDKELAYLKVESRMKQAEKLLPSIQKLLSDKNINLKDIKEIKVNNLGGSFTSLRIGVMTANALGYTLGIKVRGMDKKGACNKFSIIKPNYNKNPNISKPKKSS